MHGMSLQQCDTEQHTVHHGKVLITACATEYDCTAQCDHIIITQYEQTVLYSTVRIPYDLQFVYTCIRYSVIAVQ